MNRKALMYATVCLVFLIFAAPAVRAEEEIAPLGPWKTVSAVNFQVFGAMHLIDHADMDNYMSAGRVKPFGNEDWPGYLDRATPLYGLRIGMLFSKKVVFDFQTQYYRQYRKGQYKESKDVIPGAPAQIDDARASLVQTSNTGAMLSGIQFLLHFGVNLVERSWQLYPYVGLGWSYTNLVVNGDDRRLQRFPDFAGAKEGIPGDAGIGLEFQNPIWKSNDLTYRTAINLPIFLHVGYQGELITFFWQVKHGSLTRPVSDRFMGPYARLGIGFGRGKYSR